MQVLCCSLGECTWWLMMCMYSSPQKKEGDCAVSCFLEASPIPFHSCCTLRSSHITTHNQLSPSRVLAARIWALCSTCWIYIRFRYIRGFRLLEAVFSWYEKQKRKKKKSWSSGLLPSVWCILNWSHYISS